jgi:predicted PurR-regulated permease PerM
MRPRTSLAGQSSLRFWIGLVASAIAVWFIISHAGLLVEVILVVFTAVLLAVALRPVVDLLSHEHIPRPVTALAAYVAVIAIVGGLAYLLIPVIRSEVVLIQENAPTLFQEAVSRIKASPLGRFLPSASSLTSTLSTNLNTLVSTAVSTLTKVGEITVDVLIILVMGFFFITDADLAGRVVHDWIPASYQHRAQVVVGRMRHRLTRWMWAQIGVAVYFMVTFSAGLTILGVPFALTIGVVAGALELIPYVGGSVGLVLALLSALTVRPILLLWVIIMHIVVVEVESHIMAPALYGRATGLHPGLVLLSLLIGAKLLGIVGVLFAVPATVMVLALAEEFKVSEGEGEQPASSVQEKG